MVKEPAKRRRLTRADISLALRVLTTLAVLISAIAPLIT
jgi:hypothetical protein